MCGGGGSGGSGTQQYNWNDTLAPYWADSLAWAKGLTDPTGVGAYHQYTGPNPAVYGNSLFGISQNDPTHRIADLTPDQTAAMNNISLYGLDPTYGVQDPNQAQNAGINQEQSTLQGSYLQSDPYATASNPYGGMNSPYFNQTMQDGLDQMAKSYELGTAADTTRQMNLAGVLGGSANQNAVAANENTLANQMKQYVTGMQNDQYNRSADLASQDLSRGSTAYQDERNRMIQTLTPTQNEQGLALQRENAVLGVGDAQRSYNQDLLNQAYGDYQSQQNRQYQMLDYLSGILGRAQGGVSTNMQYTTPGYQASPFSQIIGAGLLGYGALGGH